MNTLRLPWREGKLEFSGAVTIRQSGKSLLLQSPEVIMRHRFSLGWLGASLLSFWFLSGALLVFSCITLVDAPTVSAQEEGAFDPALRHDSTVAPAAPAAEESKSRLGTVT